MCLLCRNGQKEQTAVNQHLQYIGIAHTSSLKKASGQRIGVSLPLLYLSSCMPDAIARTESTILLRIQIDAIMSTTIAWYFDLVCTTQQQPVIVMTGMYDTP